MSKPVTSVRCSIPTKGIDSFAQMHNAVCVSISTCHCSFIGGVASNKRELVGEKVGMRYLFDIHKRPEADQELATRGR